jgi:hypothetical protein
VNTLHKGYNVIIIIIIIIIIKDGKIIKWYITETDGAKSLQLHRVCYLLIGSPTSLDASLTLKSMRERIVTQGLQRFRSSRKVRPVDW